MSATATSALVLLPSISAESEMGSRERIQQEVESLSEAECTEVLGFIMQLKGQFITEEIEREIDIQRVWIDQLVGEGDDEGWIDL